MDKVAEIKERYIKGVVLYGMRSGKTMLVQSFKDIDYLLSELEQKDKELNTAITANGDLGGQLFKYQCELRDCKRDNLSLSSAKAKLKKSNDNLKAGIESLHQEIERLQVELQQAQETNQTLRDINDVLAGNVTKEVELHAKTCVKLQSAQQEIVHLKKEGAWKSEKCGEWARQCEDFKKREQKLIGFLNDVKTASAMGYNFRVRAGELLKEIGVTEE